MNSVSNLLIASGLIFLFIAGFFTWQHYNSNRLAFAKDISSVATVNPAYAPRIVHIPRLDISVPVFSADVTNGVWETTSKGASFLATSSLPGEMGNSVIYGHNWTNIFGNLPQILPGDTIEVYFSEDTKKIFVVESTATVLPSEDSVLRQTGDVRLTLYTCTGFLDSKRFVAVSFPQ